MKKAVLIEKKSDLKMLDLSGVEQHLIILLDYDLETELKARGISYKTLHDYVNMDDLLGLFLRVFRDLDGWYDAPVIKDFGNNFGLFENVGLIYNKIVSDAYFIIINYVHLIDLILQEEDIAGIVCASEENCSWGITLSGILRTIYSGKVSVEVIDDSKCASSAEQVSSSPSMKFKLMDIASKLSLLGKDKHSETTLLVGDFEKLKGLITAFRGKTNIYFLSDALNLKQYTYLLGNGGRYLARKTYGKSRDNSKFDLKGFLRCFEDNVVIPVKDINVAQLIASYAESRLAGSEEDLLSEYKRCEKVVTNLKQNDKVILDEEVSINSRMLTMLANRSGVLSEVVVHGYINHSMGFLPSICRQMYVWNEWQKDAISDFGGDSGKVLVSGCLKYEGKVPGNKLFAKKAGNNKFVILFAPTALNKRRAFNIWYYMNYFDMFFDEIRDVSKRMPLEVLVKYHPGDSNSVRIRKLIRDKGLTGIVAEIPDDQNAFKAIQKADLLVSMYSTILIDALYMNKPAVNLGPPRYRIFDDLIRFKDGLVPCIEKRGDLYKNIVQLKDGDAKAMTDSEYLSFCEEYINIAPILPSEKIVRVHQNINK